MKTTSTHTPGPWHVGGFVPKSDAQKMAYIGIGDGAQHLARASVTQCVDRIEAEANARLIAASPAMYDALRLVVAILTQPVQFAGIENAAATRILRGDAAAAVNAARAALAQIDGGSQ